LELNLTTSNYYHPPETIDAEAAKVNDANIKDIVLMARGHDEPWTTFYHGTVNTFVIFPLYKSSCRYPPSTNICPKCIFDLSPLMYTLPIQLSSVSMLYIVTIDAEAAKVNDANIKDIVLMARGHDEPWTTFYHGTVNSELCSMYLTVGR
jgi:hypothetical protein